jgi:hypothetical protein
MVRASTLGHLVQTYFSNSSCVMFDRLEKSSCSMKLIAPICAKARSVSYNRRPCDILADSPSWRGNSRTRCSVFLGS